MAAAYRKGQEIYSSSYKIVRLDIDHDKSGRDKISAVVKGSGSERYSVSGVYDNEAEELEEMSCQCLAWENYPGLCKHCVAVLLRYMDYGTMMERKPKKEKPSLSAVRRKQQIPVVSAEEPITSSETFWKRRAAKVSKRRGKQISWER